MKLKELLQENILQHEEILTFLAKFGINNKNCTIHPDGTVDLKFSGLINYRNTSPVYGKGLWIGEKVIDRLPVKFGKVKNNFDISNNDLTTLEGCPEELYGDFSCANNPRITSFKFIPKHCGKSCNISETGITSLVGIADHLRTMNGATGSFIANFSHVESGGIGLIMIPGLVHIAGVASSPLSPPFKIIRKYLSELDKLFECQTELIDAGFEEYAKL